MGIKGRLPYWVQTLLHIAYTQGKTDDNSVKHLENLFEITNSRVCYWEYLEILIFSVFYVFLQVQSWFRAAKKNNEASQPNGQINVILWCFPLTTLFRTRVHECEVYL